MSSPKYFLSLFLLFFATAVSRAQESGYKNLTEKDGLPSNEVYDIFQDRNGYVWFTTDRGLAHYNGREFKCFEPKNGITDICIFKFFPQQNGQVWCSTFNNRLFYFRNGSTRFIPYRYNSEIEKLRNALKSAQIYIQNLAIDKNGDLYLVIANMNYIKIDRNGKSSIWVDGHMITPSQFPQIPVQRYLQTDFKNKSQAINYLSNKISNVDLDPKQKSSLHFSNSGQLRFIYDTEGFSVWDKVGKRFDSHLPGYEPIGIGLLDPGHIWVGYRGRGARIYDLDGNLVRTYLENSTVTKVFRDCFGSLWISTIDAGVFFFENRLAKNILLKDIKINALTADPSGNLFVGCYNGDIYKINAGHTLEKLRSGSAKYPPYVQYSAASGQVYFATDDGVFSNAGGSMDYHGVLKITDDNRVLTYVQYAMYTTPGKDGKLATYKVPFRINDASEYAGLYYLTSIRGLRIMKDGQLIPNIPVPPDGRIDDIDFEPVRKRFYMASLGNGVVVYDPVSHKYFNIDKGAGLSDNLVTEVYIENENVIWACTNHGLNRIEFSGGGRFEVRYLTVADGLIGNQVKDIEIIGKDLYIGTSNGLCHISYADFMASFQKRHYFLRLQEFRVNNEKKPIREADRLRYSENQLAFTVDAISFKNNTLVYRYRLEGLQRNWHQTTNRKITFDYLPSGDYTLHVTVLENGRLFSTEALRIPIHIASPFWKTYWFIAGMMALGVFIIYIFFRIRVLVYNKDIIRELLRLMMKKIQRRELFLTFREQGREIRIKTDTILFISSSGNYLDIVTEDKTYTIRLKIGDFIGLVPDPLEFLRIHRSYIIRIDKVQQKSKKTVIIGNHELPVGKLYLDALSQIVF